MKQARINIPTVWKDKLISMENAWKKSVKEGTKWSGNRGCGGHND